MSDELRLSILCFDFPEISLNIFFSEGNGTTLGIGEARRNEVVQDYGNEVDKEVSFISQIQQ